MVRRLFAIANQLVVAFLAISVNDSLCHGRQTALGWLSDQADRWFIAWQRGLLIVIVRFCEPLFAWFGLPGEWALVFVTAGVVNIYAVIAVAEALDLPLKQFFCFPTYGRREITDGHLCVCDRVHVAFDRVLIAASGGTAVGVFGADPVADCGTCGADASFAAFASMASGAIY